MIQPVQEVAMNNAHNASNNIIQSVIYRNLTIGDYDPAPKYIITVKAAFANKTKLTVIK